MICFLLALAFKLAVLKNILGWSCFGILVAGVGALIYTQTVMDRIFVRAKRNTKRSEDSVELAHSGSEQSAV